jgi:hypothetical protein
MQGTSPILMYARCHCVVPIPRFARGSSKKCPTAPATPTPSLVAIIKIHCRGSPFVAGAFVRNLRWALRLPSRHRRRETSLPRTFQPIWWRPDLAGDPTDREAWPAREPHRRLADRDVGRRRSTTGHASISVGCRPGPAHRKALLDHTRRARGIRWKTSNASDTRSWG